MIFGFKRWLLITQKIKSHFHQIQQTHPLIILHYNLIFQIIKNTQSLNQQTQKKIMNKRTFSSIIGGSKNDIFMDEGNNIRMIQQEHDKKQIQYLKKQNGLLKRQLEQVKEIHVQTKKELSLYRNLVSSQVTSKMESKQQHSDRMNQVFEMQQKKIFDLETELEILRDKYNKNILNTGSIRQTEYAIKCKDLEKRLEMTQKEYEKEISYLKQKLMRVNASEIMMEKSSSNNFISSMSTDLNGLKPLSSKSRKIT